MNSIEVDTVLSKFKLKLSDKYPRDSKLYLYADYFEFVALINHCEIGDEDMLDRLRDEDIIGRNKSSDGTVNNESSMNTSVNDDDEAFIKSILKLIEQRAFLFGDLYPFNYNDERFCIKEDLSEHQKLYIFLLVASNLSLFKDCMGNITTEFEFISEKALQNYVPNYAIVQGFGKKSIYKGYAKDKIKALAEAMNVASNEKFLDSISNKGTQDLGVDIVAWLPFKDNIGNYITIFAQCACGKDWNKKLSETSRYNRLITTYLSDINHAIFVPYSLGNYNNSSFFDDYEFGNSIIVFERFRILSLLQDNTIIGELESKTLIDRVIEYQEDIV